MFSGIFKDFSRAIQCMNLIIATFKICTDNQFTQGLPLLDQKLDQPSCSQHVPSAGLLLSTVVQIRRKATYQLFNKVHVKCNNSNVQPKMLDTCSYGHLCCKDWDHRLIVISNKGQLYYSVFFLFMEQHWSILIMSNI